MLWAVVLYGVMAWSSRGADFRETDSRSTFFENFDVFVTGQVGGKRATE